MLEEINSGIIREMLETDSARAAFEKIDALGLGWRANLEPNANGKIYLSSPVSVSCGPDGLQFVGAVHAVTLDEAVREQFEEMRQKSQRVSALIPNGSSSKPAQYRYSEAEQAFVAA
ncbi:MAG: hypothetical protein GC137_07400 [Alphaproteobacteria bacterium]|nr:hypothetical protein [Alphaproteobacteria bacterium]